MDIDAPIATPHFNRAVTRFLGENFARSQLGLVVVEALDHYRRRDMILRVEEIASVGVQAWHGATLLAVVRAPPLDHCLMVDCQQTGTSLVASNLGQFLVDIP
jgi:hypothetical protein